jgi:hypothetical protein
MACYGAKFTFYNIILILVVVKWRSNNFCPATEVGYTIHNNPSFKWATNID